MDGFLLHHVRDRSSEYNRLLATTLRSFLRYLYLRGETATGHLGTRLQGCTARRTFAKLSRTIGLRQTAEGQRIGRGPRLQDFRHTFATRRFLEWYRTAPDVGREIPKLVTDLGHVEVGLTYWYIEAVPELLQLAAERLGAQQRGGV